MPREGVLGQATRIDPVPADHEALDSLRAREDLGGGELVLCTADGTEISLPSSLLRLVVSAASNLAAGRSVMTIPAEVMLTPAEAAELLGLSRPFVARLLERGDIPSELLPGSRHRRIRLEDVLAFQDRRERRSEGRRRIADIAASADLPYLWLLFVAKVFIDTNVLFPFSVMDLISCSLTEDGIHDVMWSHDLLDEWERVIVRERHRSPGAAAAITATIRQFFADTRIPVESYRELVSEVDGPDPDDNAYGRRCCRASRIAGHVERQRLRLRIHHETRDQDHGSRRVSLRPLRRVPRRGARNDCKARRQQASTAYDAGRSSRRARPRRRRVVRFASAITSDPSSRTARIILSAWTERFGQAGSGMAV